MTLASRVARRFVAAELTKQWLMGIRRAWLQFMKPPISDYNDVMKAHDKLDLFVERLRDQIKHIRRGGAKRLLDSKFEAKLAAAFDKVTKTIDESRDKARHWKSYIDGTSVSLQWGEDRTDDALKMLDLYKRDFAEASNTAIETRGQRWKTVNLTDLLDVVLKLLRADAAAIQKHDEANPDAPFEQRPEVLKEFAIGNMKFVLVLGPDDKVSAAATYAGLLKKAHAVIQAKKLKHLWYGLCFLAPSCEKLGEETIEAYELAGYDRKYIECRAGWYRFRNDTMAFTSYPTGTFVYLMIHELGHRHWFKFMTSAQRVRFADLIKTTKGDRGHRDESGVGAVVPVSDYGKSNPEEAFAEAFAHYVLGKDMTRDQMESFREVSFGRRSAMAQRIAQRYLEAGYLDVGDYVLYGKFKNARGKVVGFGKNEKGDPTVEVIPVDKDWKPKKGAKPKSLTLLKIRKVKKAS